MRGDAADRDVLIAELDAARGVGRRLIDVAVRPLDRDGAATTRTVVDGALSASDG